MEGGVELPTFRERTRGEREREKGSCSRGGGLTGRLKHEEPYTHNKEGSALIKDKVVFDNFKMK